MLRNARDQEIRNMRQFLGAMGVVTFRDQAQCNQVLQHKVGFVRTLFSILIDPTSYYNIHRLHVQCFLNSALFFWIDSMQNNLMSK